MILERFFKIPNSLDREKGESTSRSLMKSISWRIIGTVDTIIISFIITGKMTFALSIGAIELITKMVLYYVHERLWNKITWGKK